jgi:hypothetical protein
MKKKVKIMSSVRIAFAILFFIAFLTLPANVEAKAKVVAIEGMSYNVDSSLKDNLKSLIGKKVSVTLGSGQTVTGFVKEVGNHLIHLEKLSGKDFFDALIHIKSIRAIEARFREFKR